MKIFNFYFSQARIQTTATFALANLEKFTKSALSLSYLPLLTLFVALFGFVWLDSLLLKKLRAHRVGEAWKGGYIS